MSSSAALESQKCGDCIQLYKPAGPFPFRHLTAAVLRATCCCVAPCSPLAGFSVSTVPVRLLWGLKQLPSVRCLQPEHSKALSTPEAGPELLAASPTTHPSPSSPSPRICSLAHLSRQHLDGPLRIGLLPRPSVSCCAECDVQLGRCVQCAHGFLHSRVMFLKEDRGIVYGPTV